MPNAVALDKVQHRDLKVIGGHGPQFGDITNEIEVFANEFIELQREYPIYFHRDERGGWQAYAMLGFDDGENLFVADGAWQGRYIPAMLDRGPFLMGFPGSKDEPDAKREPVIAIDMEHPRVSRDQGELLFQSDGSAAPRLERHARALKTIHEGHNPTRIMFAAFAECGLLSPIKIDIRIDDSTIYNVPDAYSINHEALVKLDNERLGRLLRAGYLNLAYAAINSLGNIRRLIDLKNQRKAG
ncbi:hypothetical protein ABAC460_18975 [Asticcacaulis sp. AC460]|uniref:SapC family protein n=1 Tax=Asticcacaulis sp. AC460 TaxID=1282360 RepID=UPI0003C3E2F7|nr:SapC family protein [Asticcacaulis sp. AC460]ESQ87411.1 hypothetical protein ABAC460_18975 [Asticcacaulis sp. AC460]